MELFPAQSRPSRGRGLHPGSASDRGAARGRNKTWLAPGMARATAHEGGSTRSGADADRWERGGHRTGRGRGSGRGRGGRSSRSPLPESAADGSAVQTTDDEATHDDDMTLVGGDIEEPELKTPEEREAFFKELVKARELERVTAIKEGKLDDPTVPKRLEDAITVVGTCRDMCPRFERYRRERENNLFECETIPGTRRVDHKRAVKMYERAAGDKIVPSDLRPPPVLKRTLDYLFHDLMQTQGFSASYNFIRDRSRAVRNDFTLQLETGALAIECNERCARFHILALHVQRGVAGVSGDLDEQQLMNCLQTLKEFYLDQRGRYESANELEIRIYHRLIHIRNQKERHDDIPESIRTHPVFLLTTRFRERVQKISSPIKKKSPLKVDAEAMEIFGELVGVLQAQGNAAMVYLVACILEWHFGNDTIEDIESIRGDFSYSDIIDGEARIANTDDEQVVEQVDDEEAFLSGEDEHQATELDPATSLEPSTVSWAPSQPGSSGIFGSQQAASSAFASAPSVNQSTAFPSLPTSSPFPADSSAFPTSKSSPFGVASSSPFGQSGAKDAFGRPVSAFGVPTTSAFGTSPQTPAWPSAGMPVNGTAPAPTPSLPTASAPSPAQPPSVPSTTPSFFSNPVSAPAPAQTTPAPAPSFGDPSAPASSSISQPKPSPFGARLNPQAPAFTPLATTSTQPPPTEISSVTPGRTLSAERTPTPTSTTSKRPTLTPLNTTPPPFAQPRHSTSNELPKGPSMSSLPDVIASPMLPQPPSPKLEPVSLPPTPTLGPSGTPVLSAAPMPLFPSSSFSRLSQPDSILSPLNLTGPSFSRAAFGTAPGPASPVVSRQGSFAPTPSVSRKPSLISDSPLKNGVPFPTNESISHLPSPFTKKSPSSPVKPAQSFSAKQPPSPPAVNGKIDKGKGKQRAIDEDDAEYAALVLMANVFVLKHIFEPWARKAAYKRAVRRAEEYTHRRRMSISSEGSDSRKRRSAADGDSDAGTAERRRVKRRISSRFQPPRTDDDLARRLQENREQHERRWAPGTFLQAVRDHVVDKAGAYPFDYRVWLSMNESTDATAIWLEKKFDVPESGMWLSDKVFSIPLLPGDQDSTSPGLIVFECSPVGGVDEVERKYRALDDYARFKEAIKALPEDRHFIPSLLLVVWANSESDAVPAELEDEIKRLCSAGLLLSRVVLTLTETSTDLDEKFCKCLSALDMDITGRLVEMLTARELLIIAFMPFEAFVSDWYSRAMSDGDEDWELFSALLRTAVELLNSLSRHLTERVAANAIDGGDILPPLDVDARSFESLRDSLSAWLNHPNLRQYSQDCYEVLSTLATPSDFSAAGFFTALIEMAIATVLATIPRGTEERYTVSKRGLAGIKEDADKDVTKAGERLRAVFAFHVRPKQRSPKRRSLEDDSSSASSHVSKKAKMLFSDDEASMVCEIPNGATLNLLPPPSATPSATPSPALSMITVADETPPKVTLSMLRALSKSVLKEQRPH